MSGLLTIPSSTLLWALAVVLAALFGGFVHAFLVLERPLAPDNSFKYEFAATPARAGDMFRRWGAAGRPIMRRSLHLDFYFMVVYAFMYAVLTLLATRGVAHAWAQPFGLWLVLAPFVAWVLDIVENLGLLAALNQYKTPPAGPLAVSTAAASIKFVLLLACSLFWLGVIFRLL